MEILKGLPVSPGIAIAEAYVLDSVDNIDIPRRFVRAEETERERDRFFDAVKKAQQEIRDLQSRFVEEMGGEVAPIFDAHVMILADSSFHQEVVRRIMTNRFSAEYAVSRSLRKFEKAFYSMPDPYLAQRVSDIQDIERRLLQALMGEREQALQEIDRRVMLVAHDITPSQAASLNREYVVGFCTAVGGQTGHTAIIARAREIPAVVGLGSNLSDITRGDTLVIDGNMGVVVINPDEDMLDQYRRREDDYHSFERSLLDEKDLPAVTTGGVEVTVDANVEFPSEVEQVERYGADGIGLYRTEFLYLQSGGEPSEDQHYEAYKSAVDICGDRPVVVRTLDLGADKFFQKDPSLANERNPFLGCRSIRYCRLRPQIFRTQARAICRASAHGDVRMMLPLVTVPEEMHFARSVLAEVQEELATEDIAFNPDMQLGMMVEIPGTALMLDAFMDVSDFFSIGTNDLIQYTLAVDRTSEHVADLYQPSNPAVLRLVRSVIETCDAHHVPVSLCGEMGGDPTYVLLLLGMGLRKFSVTPPVAPEVKKLVRSVSIDEARALADHVAEMRDPREITGYLRGVTREHLPEWTFL